MTDLLYLDPFVEDAVHESDIWGEEEGTFQDVPSIHTEAFEALQRDLEMVSKQGRHRTMVRFLVGGPGSGKSHLFSRLRRRLGEAAVFAFASNPPTRPAAFLPWTLEKVVHGLGRPRLVEGEVKPYSQLEALLYQQGVGLERDSLDGVHTYVSGLSDDGRRFFLERIHNRLVAKGYDEQTLRGMVGVLRPEHREVAFRWLSGSTNLRDEELQALGQQRPLEEEEADKLLKHLGRLSEVAQAPLVLVLDQLDLMTQPEQIDQIQRLLMGLINESSNWYVIIGLIQDKLAHWQPHLTAALHSRIRNAEGNLPVLELQHLTDPAQKEALVRQRLSSPALRRARQESGGSEDTFPFTADDCRDLSGGPAILPRDLLALASARYAERVAGRREEPAEESLEARLHMEFRRRREAMDPAGLVVEKASLADRVSEATELLAVARGLGTVVSKAGPLERNPRFKGTDSAIDIGGRTLRIVAHHVHRGASFPSFLQKLSALPRGSLLVRDAIAAISGRVTTERLAAFQAAGNRFLHLPRPALADLLAMGEVLAEMREGNFARLHTSPPPTEENIKAALATLPWVTGGPLALALLELLRPDTARKPQEAEPPAAAPRGGGEPTRPGPPDVGAASESTASLVAAVEALLRPARWLMFERLRLWLAREHAEVSTAELRGALERAPLASSVLRYPRSVPEPTDVQILIWNDDDA